MSLSFLEIRLCVCYILHLNGVPPDICNFGPGKEYAPGYEGIVELSKEIVRGRSSKQQQETVSNILDSLLPPDAGKAFRRLFPFSQV